MRPLILLLLVSALAGCGSPHSKAVDACKTEIAAKVAGKQFALDESDMAAKATVEPDGLVRIQSGITFDPGMPREVKQTFDCRVRVADGTATVISLGFIW